MKTTITLILMLCLQNIIFSQSKGKTEKKEDHLNLCVLNYVGNSWVITHNDSVDHQCDDLVIKSLPAMDQSLTPIDLNMEYKGFYTLKKDPSLMLSDDYHVVIEDMLTGTYYNLNSTEAYPFKINRASKDMRFRMEIKKNKNKSLSGQTASIN